MIAMTWTTVEFSAWFGVAATVVAVVATYVRALAKINEVEDRVKQYAENYVACRGMQDKRHEDIRDGFADLRERLARLEALVTTIVARFDSLTAANGVTHGKRKGGRHA